MKKICSLRVCLAIAALAAMSLTMAAHEGDGPDVESSMLYAPLVYDNYAPEATAHPANTNNGLYSLDAGDQWLRDAMDNSSRTHRVRQRAMIDNPQLVAYNANRLPEAPPEGVIPSDPRQGMLSVAPPQVVV